MRTRTHEAKTARAHLPELLERAHYGMPTIITKRGKAYAVILPVGNAPVRRTSMLSLKGSGAGLRNYGAVASVRDEWE
jgi:prevent-host-death family protein